MFHGCLQPASIMPFINPSKGCFGNWLASQNWRRHTLYNDLRSNLVVIVAWSWITMNVRACWRHILDRMAILFAFWSIIYSNEWCSSFRIHPPSNDSFIQSSAHKCDYKPNLIESLSVIKEKSNLWIQILYWNVDKLISHSIHFLYTDTLSHTGFQSQINVLCIH